MKGESMRELCIPLPFLEEQQVAEVEVKIGDKKQKFDFRLESFPWGADKNADQGESSYPAGKPKTCIRRSPTLRKGALGSHRWACARLSPQISNAANTEVPGPAPTSHRLCGAKSGDSPASTSNTLRSAAYVAGSRAAL